MGKPAKLGAAALTPGLTPDEFNRLIIELNKKAMEEARKFFAEGVKEGIKRERARIAAEEKKKEVDPYKATEKRLYALPDLKTKVKEEKQQLKDIQRDGMPRRSTDVIRFNTGFNDDPAEILIKHKKAIIASDAIEIQTIEKALEKIKDDYYFPAIPARYFKEEKDEKIAVDLHCDASTVRRNRNRLVRRLAVLLYGAAAVG